MMFRLLLLGGSAQQVIAIETAKRLGCYTILCDYLSDNPGQYAADKFYRMSTTDKKAILEIAIKEDIDGVIAYASDPAAPTAAYVAEKMHLPGNPYKSVEILCNKDKFRKFLQENGFNTPKAVGYRSVDDIVREKDEFAYPIIIKPVDSSGSKGVTVLYDSLKIKEAAEFAFSFSRGGRIVAEEYLEKKHPYLIGGDIFVSDGKVILWGLMNCHRDQAVNPLVPVGKSYPVCLSYVDEQAVRSTLQKLVTNLGFNNGPMNVELIVNKDGKVYPIDIGPRSGGNMIPDLLGMIFDVDVVEMSIKAAMGEQILDNLPTGTMYYATHNLHSSEEGTYNTIEFSPKIEKFIVKKCLYKKPGDEVHYFDNASKALGIVFMKFESQDEMMLILTSISDHIKVVLEEKN